MKKRNSHQAKAIGSNAPKDYRPFHTDNSRWNATLVILCALVFAFYLWTAGTNGVPFLVDIGPEEYFKQVPTPCLFPDISPHHYGFYNLMADAYEKGRADLLLDPPKELLELNNPRDPAQNAQWRILDLSIYKGRYYLYFGPVPALTVFIPFRWLGIGKISEPLAAVIFCYGLFLCSVYIFLGCVKAFFPNCNRLFILSGVVALGLSNTVPYLLRHPTVYEVAIASGAFFSMLGMCFLFKAWRSEPLRCLWLWAASLCFGLSVGCRPIFIFSGLFLFAVWVGFCWRQGLFSRDSLKKGFALATPFVLCVASVAWFNYIRFGSLGDFGLELQMNATLWNFAAGYRLSNIAPGLFLRAVCPPQISDVFPFVRLHQFYPLSLPDDYSLEEVSGGFLTTSPVILLFLLIAPFWMKRSLSRPCLQVCFPLIVSGAIILLIESFIIFGNSMRYQLDFAPPLLLSAVIGMASMAAQPSRRTLLVTAIALLWVGVILHIFISFTGFRDTLRRGEPGIYYGLEDALRPISNLLAPLFRTDNMNLLDITPQIGTVRFSDGSEGYPIKSSGVQIRLHSPPSVRLQFSCDVILADEKNPIYLEFHSPSATVSRVKVDRSGFYRWSFVTRGGSNRFSLMPVSDLESSSPIAFIKNLNLSQEDR